MSPRFSDYCSATVPGDLKNMIDWASRFRSQPFKGKQGFVLSASPAMGGGNRGLWSLCVPLEHLGARVYPDMFSLAQGHDAFDARGGIANGMLQQRSEDTLGCFVGLAEAAERHPGFRKKWIEFLGERPDLPTDRIETSDVGAEPASD
jgi:chromate reductase, NAD(P)H dehydrogenase (quinone)